MRLSGVRTVADVSTVARNAGFQMFAHASDIHEEWRCGPVTLFIRDDLCGAVTTLVRCPAWAGDMRLPPGVPLDLVASVLASAQSEASRCPAGAAS